jgi:ParB family chromosome partitioning protein
MKSKKGLGKGLDALLIGLQEEKTLPASTEENQNGFLEIPIQQLTAGKYQPRHEVLSSNLEPLMESIRAQGIIQPIIVRPLSDNRYEIIAGERRFRAAELLGLTSVPVIVKEVKDEHAIAMALIENIQREDLNPIEEAIAFERLAKEFNLTHIQVAETLGKSRTTITNSIRLLSLGDDIKKMLVRKEIEVGHAKVLLSLRTEQQRQIAQKIVQKGLSVRETERLVAELADEKSSRSPNMQGRSLDPDIRRLQNNLSDKLGAMVLIQHGQHGKGKILIQYNNLDELEGILEHIQ